MSSKDTTPSHSDSHDDSESAVTTVSLGAGSPFGQRVSATGFDDWLAQRAEQANLDEQYSHRNDPGHSADPRTHSPSQVFGCQRKSVYRNRNAPAEDNSNLGYLEFGNHFEEIWETFLRTRVTTDSEYVQNPVPIAFDVELGGGDGGQLTFRGSTDPVIVDKTGTPLLLTEAKTTGSVEYVKGDGPKRRHLAQAHVYAKGLQQAHDLDDPPTMCIVYGDRDSLETAIFFEDFDPNLWEEVIEYARTESAYRVDNVLPPTIDDDQQYMCGYCEFSKRCGNYEPGEEPERRASGWTGDLDYYFDNSTSDKVLDGFDDQPVAGFVPLKHYPESSVVDHLVAHEVKLTPTLAHQHPALVDDGTLPPDRLFRRYGTVPQAAVHDWQCPHCTKSVAFDAVEWDGDLDEPPECSRCNHYLRGPTPKEVQ